MLPFKPIRSDNPFYIPVRIVAVVQETEEAKTFVINPVKGSLSYKAGQFLTFVFRTGDVEERRSYSISSSPECDEPLAITIKRISNGAFSRPLLESGQPGDVLTLAGGAAGFFTLPDDSSSFDQIVFLAGGSGITPVFSLIKTALKRFPTRPLTLVYSNSKEEKTIFRKSLQELQRSHADRFRIEWLFSNNQDLSYARLNKGLLSELLHKHRRGSFDRMLCFMCGPFDYMRMSAIVLQSSGIPADLIKREVFIPLIPVSTARPPDVERHSVGLHFQGKEHSIDVQYPETILAAARKAGIMLPYSCEAGRCGSCVATCTKGKIWMRYNEVLTDAEVEKGRVLICNGFPVGGDAAVDFDKPFSLT